MAVTCSVEIDDAGERGDASQVTLKGRLAAALHRLNPTLPHNTIEEVVRTLSRPPHPTLIQNKPLVPRNAHRRRRDRVSRIEQRRDARRPRAPGRFRQPGHERSTGIAPAPRRRSVEQGHPPGPDSVPERAPGRVDRAESPRPTLKQTWAWPSTSSTATCRPPPTCSCRTWCWWSRTAC